MEMKIGKTEKRLLFSWIIYAGCLVTLFLSGGEGRNWFGLTLAAYLYPIVLVLETRWYIKEKRKANQNG